MLLDIGNQGTRQVLDSFEYSLDIVVLPATTSQANPSLFGHFVHVFSVFGRQFLAECLSGHAVIELVVPV